MIGRYFFCYNDGFVCSVFVVSPMVRWMSGLWGDWETITEKPLENMPGKCDKTA